MMHHVFLFCVLCFASALAFAPHYQQQKQTALSLAVAPPPQVEINMAINLQNGQQLSTSLDSGVQNYLASDAVESSSIQLSLKERPPPPTKEEIEAKKRNFNFWFWGGGFVAPFIATIYYFGPKFWKY